MADQSEPFTTSQWGVRNALQASRYRSHPSHPPPDGRPVPEARDAAHEEAMAALQTQLTGGAHIQNAVAHIFFLLGSRRFSQFIGSKFWGSSLPQLYAPNIRPIFSISIQPSFPTFHHVLFPILPNSQLGHSIRWPCRTSQKPIKHQQGANKLLF